LNEFFDKRLLKTGANLRFFSCLCSGG